MHRSTALSSLPRLLVPSACCALAAAAYSEPQALPLAAAEQAVLEAPDGASQDRFGVALDLDGDTLVVGASGHNTGSGAAYVFVRTGSSWGTPDKLRAPDGGPWDAFGSAVAVEGDRIAVGAPGEEVGSELTGAVYVFARSEGSWIFEEKLLPSGSTGVPTLGRRVAVSGDRVAAVGQLQNGVDGVFMFLRSGSSWSQEASFVPSQGVPGGWSSVTGLDLRGDLCAAGAPSDFDPSFASTGSTSVYRRDGANWVLETRFWGAVDDWLGYAVALNGNLLVAGAPLYSGAGATFVGSVSVFRVLSSGWVVEDVVVNPGPKEFAQFGYALGTDGGRLAVGIPQDDRLANDAGAVSIFRRFGSDWRWSMDLFASDGAAQDQFGQQVGLVEDTLVVGAPGHDTDAGGAAGAVYVYSLQQALDARAASPPGGLPVAPLTPVQRR